MEQSFQKRERSGNYVKHDREGEEDQTYRNGIGGSKNRERREQRGKHNADFYSADDMVGQFAIFNFSRVERVAKHGDEQYANYDNVRSVHKHCRFVFVICA